MLLDCAVVTPHCAALGTLAPLRVDKALGRHLVRNCEAATVPKGEKTLLHFAEKVTREPVPG